jgi:hypothetical protein
MPGLTGAKLSLQHLDVMPTGCCAAPCDVPRDGQPSVKRGKESYLRVGALWKEQPAHAVGSREVLQHCEQTGADLTRTLTFSALADRAGEDGRGVDWHGSVGQGGVHVHGPQQRKPWSGSCALKSRE